MSSEARANDRATRQKRALDHGVCHDVAVQH